MKRRFVAVAVAVGMALMSFPGQVTAHDSTVLDLNDLAYDNVWPLIGPGGVTDNETLNNQLRDPGGQGLITLRAEKQGGDVTPESAASCNHHDPGIVDANESFNTNDECQEGMNTLTFYQCTGRSPDDPLQEADLTARSPMPFAHSNLSNGVTEATGSFFVPAELTGDDADKVEELWFGFLTTFAWPISSVACQDPFPMPGAYYEFYRGDTDGEPWEIPINTLLVPDAPYGAIVRAIDGNGSTLGATFAYANVNNYLNDANWQPSTPSVCDQDSDTGTALCPYHDVVPPRATVFKTTEHAAKFPRINEDVHDPSDATDEQQCAASFGADAVALEYGEKLATDGDGFPHVEIVDGSGGPVDWHNYTAPGRDVDSVPGIPTVNDGTGTTDIWGPGICIIDPPNEMTVKAWDQSGNVGTQFVSK